MRRPPCSEPRQLAPLVSPGHTDTVTWPWACLLKELPLSRPQVSGNQMLGGLTFFSLSFKATGAGQGQLHFQLRKGEGVYTHTHKPNRLLQVCFSDTLETTQFRALSSHTLGLPSRNVSSDGCVNTAALGKLASPRDAGICQEKNRTGPLGWAGRGIGQSSKGGWASNWTRRFPDYTVATDPSKGHCCSHLGSQKALRL